MYLVTKDSHTFGRKLYYIVGSCSTGYVATQYLQGYYAKPENWLVIKEEDTEIVDSNELYLRSKL